MATRESVYQAIDGERLYQDARWVTDGYPHVHTVTEWLVYIDSYLREAMYVVSRGDEPACTEQALHIVRKIAAMGVACMEQNGAPHRQGYEPRDDRQARTGMKL